MSSRAGARPSNRQTARPSSSSTSTNVPNTAPARTTRRTTRSASSEFPASEPPAARTRRRQRSPSRESEDLAHRPDQRGKARARQKKQQQQQQQRKGKPSLIPEAVEEDPEAVNADQFGNETQGTIIVASGKDLSDEEVADSPLEGNHEPTMRVDEPRSPTLTGTTARPSYSTEELERLRPSEMIDNLPDLWDSARKLVHLLAPQDPSLARLKRLYRDLADGKSRESKNKSKFEDTLTANSAAYGGRAFIDVTAALLALVKASGIRFVGDVQLQARADEPLYMANLARLVQLMLPSSDRTRNFESQDILNRAFPQSFLSGFGHEIGQSSLVQETLDLAIELRTQYFVAVVETQSSAPSFTAQEALAQTFFEEGEEDTALKGWDIDEMQPSGQNGKLERLLRARIERLSKIIENNDDSQVNDYQDLLEVLRKDFPADEFLCRLVTWTRARADELQGSFRERRSGDIEDLQKALDILNQSVQASQVSSRQTPEGEEFLSQRLGSEAVDQSTNRSHDTITPSRSPDKSQRTNTRSIRNNVILTEEQSSSLQSSSAPIQPFRNKYHTAGNKSWLERKKADHEANVAAIAGQERTAPDVTRQDILGSEIQSPPTRQEHDLPSTQDIHNGEEYDAEIPLSQDPFIQRAIKVKSRTTRRTNAPAGQRRQGRFLDPQPNAGRVTFSEVDTQDSPRPTPTGDASNDGFQAISDIEEEDEDAFQTDSRQQFQQPHVRPSRGRKRQLSEEPTSTPPSPAKRRRGERDSSYQPPAPRQQIREHAESEEEDDDDDDDEATTTRYQRPPPASAAQVLREARAAIPEHRYATEPKRRIPWTRAEDDVLLLGLNVHKDVYNKYKLIQRDDTAGILAGRDNVALKDRARNLRIQYHVAGFELPDGLKVIPLKEADKRKLESRGITYE